MISIISGLESLASQRRRNNWLTVEMKNGAPANYWSNRNAPHPGVSGGGGDGERSHGLKLNYITILYDARMTAY
jgi:hypothetical protein